MFYEFGVALVYSVYEVSTVTVKSSALTSLTSRSLTHPEQLLVPQAPLTVSALCMCLLFNLLYHVYTTPSLYLGVFRYTTLTTVLHFPTVLSTVPCCTGVQPRSSGLDHVACMCSRPYHPGGSSSTLYDVHTATKSPRDFLTVMHGVQSTLYFHLEPLQS